MQVHPRSKQLQDKNILKLKVVANKMKNEIPDRSCRIDVYTPKNQVQRFVAKFYADVRRFVFLSQTSNKD